MRKITMHIVHCSASKQGDVKKIRHWHLARGFSDVGYHFIIRRDGEIEVGRQLTEIGAHARGYNTISIGTCLVGDKDFAPQQFASLRKLHASLSQQFSGLEAVPHNQLNKNKTCPNFDLSKALRGEV